MPSPFWSSFPYLLSLFVIFFCIISLSHLSICHFSPQHLLVIFAPDLSVCHSPSFIYLGYFLSCHFSISHFSHVICILVITPSPLPLSLYWFFLHIISLTVNPSIIILSASPPSSSYWSFLPQHLSIDHFFPCRVLIGYFSPPYFPIGHFFPTSGPSQTPNSQIYDIVTPNEIKQKLCRQYF